jgi:hypothetical protein
LEDLVPISIPLLPGARCLAQSWLLLAPQGGQQQARRNAWAAMSATSARTRERRLAQEALRSAAQRAHGRQALGGGTGR